MPRQARIDAPGALRHIICRGIERRPIFKDDSDRTDFVGRLSMLLPKTATRCYARALIPNHFHLLLKTAIQGDILYCPVNASPPPLREADA